MAALIYAKSKRKGVYAMPNLKHLLDELLDLDVDPRQVKLPGPLYDDLLDQAEDINDQGED